MGKMQFIPLKTSNYPMNIRAKSIGNFDWY